MEHDLGPTCRMHMSQLYKGLKPCICSHGLGALPFSCYSRLAFQIDPRVQTFQPSSCLLAHPRKHAQDPNSGLKRSLQVA